MNVIDLSITISMTPQRPFIGHSRFIQYKYVDRYIVLVGRVQRKLLTLTIGKFVLQTLKQL